MNLTNVNSIIRQLGKFKSAIPNFNCPYQRQFLLDSDHPLLDELNQKVAEIEDLLVDLKSINNSSAAKITKWFKHDLPNLNLELSELFKIRATESNFSLTIDPEKAFNLNLKSNRSYQPENADDMQFYNENISRKINFSQSINPQYSDFALLTDCTFNPRMLTLDFKYFKKLVKDERIMNDILLEVCTLIKNQCKFSGKP
jgi:hypothetical protein